MCACAHDGREIRRVVVKKEKIAHQNQRRSNERNRKTKLAAFTNRLGLGLEFRFDKKKR